MTGVSKELWAFILASAILGIISGCSVRKFIPEDQFLYSGAELEIDTVGEVKDFDELKSVLEGLNRPAPNKKFLGMHPGLYFHYKAQVDSGWVNRFLDRKIGEKPVYLDKVKRENVEELMYNRLENRGHFFSSISSTIDLNKKKKSASVTYRVQIPRYYELSKYEQEGDSLIIQQEINKYLSNSILKEGMRFDLEEMKLERENIDEYLKTTGYYNFNSDFLHFQADTNQYDDKKFNLFLSLKNNIPKKALIPYRISEINVYPNYQIGQDTSSQDTVRYKNKNYISVDEYFKPEKLDPFIKIQEGEYYNPGRSQNTSRRLGTTGAYKFVNIRYQETDSLANDTLGALEASIYLSPLSQRAIRTELQAVTKSNSFSGPSLAIIYSNRNLFKGGEILDVTLNAGYETQIGRSKAPGVNSIQLSLKGDLIFPRVLLPITIRQNWFDYSIPKTKVSMGGEYISRTNLFTMASLQSAYGFLWSGNRFVTHELNPVSITYLNLLKRNPEFEAILDQNPFLKSSFDQKFIAGMTYSYTYNGMVDQRQKHQFYWNTNIDIAGNLLSLMTGHQSRKPKTFLNMEYAQYAKLDGDIRYHIKLGHHQKLATRIFAGLGMAYGNSGILPYSKQFYSGGPYSVRAFNTRALGPGSYSPREPSGENASYFDQTGNLRLEANAEYRFPLYSYLKGAVFIDAGNVWSTNEDNTLPGGRFGSDFLNKLGIGAGVGVRLDIQSFVIRIDLAVPLHDPALPIGKRWTYDIQHPVLNLAVGYPF